MKNSWKGLLTHQETTKKTQIGRDRELIYKHLHNKKDTNFEVWKYKAFTDV